MVRHENNKQSPHKKQKEIKNGNWKALAEGLSQSILRGCLYESYYRLQGLHEVCLKELIREFLSLPATELYHLVSWHTVTLPVS